MGKPVDPDPLVNVFRQWPGKNPGDQAVYPKTWPKHDWAKTKPCAEVIKLSRALQTGFRHPAYFVAYAPCMPRRRLSKEVLYDPSALAKCSGVIQMQLFLCDVDGPGHGKNEDHKEHAAKMDAWWLGEKPKVKELLKEHLGLFVYRSRGGYRILGRLREIFNMSGPGGDAAWTNKYISWVNYLKRKFNIFTHGKDSADKLADWTRLQRVPFDSRDFKDPDRFEFVGDPAAVGVWDPKLEAEDIPQAREQRPSKSVTTDSGSMLLALVQARGLRCEDVGAGEYDICCPRYQMHSPNASGERDYPGKTHLYTGQGRLGGIKCFSDGCTHAHPTPGDWVDEFSWEEKLAARRALGHSTLGEPRALTLEQLRVARVSENTIAILIEGLDDSKPDKSVQSCVHQVACAMLRSGLMPEDVLGCLTAETYAISKHVLAQKDPSWYVQETLDRAQAALEEQKVLEAAPATDSAESIAGAYTRLLSWAARTREQPFGDDDADLAAMAVAVLGPYRCRRIVDQGNWIVRNEHVWQFGEEGHVRNLLQEICKCISADLMSVKSALKGAGRSLTIQAWCTRGFGREELEDDKREEAIKYEQERMQKMVTRLKSTAGLNAVSTLVGDTLMLRMDDLDKNVDQVVFTNGTWDAISGKFIPNRPEAFATHCIPIAWATPTTGARSKWLQYIGELGFDDETLQFIQRFLGYSILGRGTEKRFGWFRGEGDTSKSTLIEIVAKCLGSYAKTTLTSVWLTKGGSAPGHTDELASLRGARFVYADEFPKISRFDDALMKKVTSGMGMLRVSFKGKTGFEYRVSFTPYFASNYDPQISEDDQAFLNRLTTMTFKHKIAPGKKDPNFVSKFLAQDDQKLAVLEWLMQGAYAYVHEGLGKEPAQVIASRKEFLSDQVSIEDQLHEVIERESGTRTPIQSVLMRLAELQAKTRQRANFTQNQIKKVICAKFGATLSDGGGIQCFIGIGLRKPRGVTDPSAEPDPEYVPDDNSFGFEAPNF